MNYYLKNIALFFVIMATIVCCTKKINTASVEEPQVEPTLVDSVYTSDQPYNLTIIYFVPADMGLNPNYKRRISEYLTHEQKYTSDWMQKWGYGKKTFGLRKNYKGEVEINVVYGKLPTSGYPYSGGAAPMSREIEAWFAANPSKKTSDHVFILTAVNQFGKQIAPYYGTGTWAYAVDFSSMEIANMGKADTTGHMSDWIGGNFHEMLHGLGLPHNGGLASENKLYGIPNITGNGGGFVTAKTYLSSWDCALLSLGQTFSTTTRTDWYQPTGAKITRLNASYDNAANSVIVSGRFVSNKKVLYVGFTNDAKRSEGDGDYDSENWITTPVGSDSFYTKISVDEFKDKRDFINDFRISFLHENGTRDVFTYSYQMTGGKPDIQFADRPMYNKTHWKIVAFSSEETSAENGRAINLIDDDMSSLWVSRWSSNSPAHPHNFTIDMGAVLPVNRFTFYQRSGSSRPKDIHISISNDNASWQALGNYSLANRAGPVYVTLPAAQSFRYYRVTINNAHDGTQWAALGEIGTYKD